MSVWLTQSQDLGLAYDIEPTFICFTPDGWAKLGLTIGDKLTLTVPVKE